MSSTIVSSLLNYQLKGDYFWESSKNSLKAVLVLYTPSRYLGKLEIYTESFFVHQSSILFILK